MIEDIQSVQYREYPKENMCTDCLKIMLLYLNNSVFLSRNYRLIVAPRKFDVLKTNICPRSEASRANMLVLRTSNSMGQRNYQTDSSETFTLYCLHCSSLKFSSARQFKNYIESFSTFSDESYESQMENLKKKTNKNLLNTI